LVKALRNLSEKVCRKSWEHSIVVGTSPSLVARQVTS
jgi:hypothetical protein